MYRRDRCIGDIRTPAPVSVSEATVDLGPLCFELTINTRVCWSTGQCQAAMFSLIKRFWIIFHTANFNQQGSPVGGAPAANGHRSLIARALPSRQLRHAVTHAGPAANLYLGVCVCVYVCVCVCVCVILRPSELYSRRRCKCCGVAVCVRLSPSVISAHRLEVCRRQLSMPAACVDDVDEVKQWLPKYHLVSLGSDEQPVSWSVTSGVN